MELAGKVALVTGGAVRVGRAISLMLARQGAHVVVNYHSSAQAALETTAEARALGADALAVQCDVADPEAVANMAQAIAERFGGVNVIVNSASHFARTPFPSSDPAVLDTWRTVTRILVDGPYYVCNALVPGMLRRGGGAIVNVVDLTVHEPWRGFAAHAVGKSALWAFTRQLALDLAPHIRVNAVAPGNVLPPPDFTPAQIEASARRALLKRWGSPDDVAQAVRYLLEADFVTGELLTVDGGERFGRTG